MRPLTTGLHKSSVDSFAVRIFGETRHLTIARFLAMLFPAFLHLKGVLKLQHVKHQIIQASINYRKYSFSGPGAYYFKRPRTPATIGGPALIRGPALNISLKFSTPLFEENCLRGFKIVK